MGFRLPQSPLVFLNLSLSLSLSLSNFVSNLLMRLLPIRCSSNDDCRSFEQQRLLGSTVLSRTPTPKEITDNDHVHCIDNDYFTKKDLTRIVNVLRPSHAHYS